VRTARLCRINDSHLTLLKRLTLPITLHRTDEHICQFACLGLRTLVLGHKIISQEQFNTFSLELETANQSIVNRYILLLLLLLHLLLLTPLLRAKFVREVYQDMEQGLTLVGATGIEDRLQEEVVETVKDLKLAGIKVCGQRKRRRR
jgi:magnesium-transporting ATPase (P-type)